MQNGPLCFVKITDAVNITLKVHLLFMLKSFGSLFVPSQYEMTKIPFQFTRLWKKVF